jgi:hypothetical protein
MTAQTNKWMPTILALNGRAMITIRHLAVAGRGALSTPGKDERSIMLAMTRPSCFRHYMQARASILRLSPSRREAGMLRETRLNQLSNRISRGERRYGASRL